MAGNDNGNSGFRTGWGWDKPFGSIPGAMPDARSTIDIGPNGSEGSPEAYSPATGTIPSDEDDVYATPPPTTPAGPSPSDPGYAPPGASVPGYAPGYPPVGENGPPADAGAPREHPESPAVPLSGEGPGPGWAEAGGMVGPEIGAGAPAPAPKKNNAGMVVAGVGGLALGLGGLILAISRGRKG